MAAVTTADDHRPHARVLVVTGMPRSGTTVLGGVFASAGGSRSVWEPFNQRCRVGVPDYYPYVGPSSSPGKRELYRGLIADTVRLRNIRGVPVEPRSRRDRVLRVLGTSARDRRYRLQSFTERLRPSSNLVLKDPIAAFLSELLVTEVGASILVSVRHPGAMLHSYRQRGWGPGALGPWTSQDDAAADLMDDADRSAVAAASPIEALGIRWRLTYAYLQAVANRFPNHVQVVRHEDAVDDATALRRAAEALQWPLSPAAVDDFAGLASGAASTHAGRLSTVMARDGGEAARGWRHEVSADDLDALAAGAGELARRFYPEPDAWSIG